MLRVWVSDFQMERTGTPFSVGSRVQVKVSPEVDTEWLALAIGPDSAESINYIEDPHASDPGAVLISGSVTSIGAVQCLFSERADERGMWPVPGSAQISAVAYAAQWVPDEPPRRFVGWIVELNHHYVIPT